MNNKNNKNNKTFDQIPNIFTICVFSSQGVVTDRTLQELLGRLLEGEQEEFYVNARRTQRNSQSQKLYKYSFSDPAIKMFQQTSRVRGDCLVVSSHQGHLQSAGVQCNKRRRPLCYRVGQTFSLARMERQDTVTSCEGG